MGAVFFFIAALPYNCFSYQNIIIDPIKPKFGMWSTSNWLIMSVFNHMWVCQWMWFDGGYTYIELFFGGVCQ